MTPVDHTMYLCPRCRGIMGSYVPHDDDGIAYCPVCRTKFLPHSGCGYCKERGYDVYTWLDEWWNRVQFDEPVIETHRRALIEAVAPVSGPGLNGDCAP